MIVGTVRSVILALRLSWKTASRKKDGQTLLVEPLPQISRTISACTVIFCKMAVHELTLV